MNKIIKIIAGIALTIAVMAALTAVCVNVANSPEVKSAIQTPITTYDPTP